MPPLITLFVACYNEADNIEGTLDVIRAACAGAGMTSGSFYDRLHAEAAKSHYQITRLNKFKLQWIN